MKLAANLRVSLYGTLAVLVASGVASLGWPSLSMRVHGAAAMAVLALTGGVIALHSAGAWRERRNLHSGLALASALLALSVTGYLLYYVGEDGERAFASIAHWVVGVTTPLVVAWHVRVK